MKLVINVVLGLASVGLPAGAAVAYRQDVVARPMEYVRGTVGWIDRPQAAQVRWVEGASSELAQALPRLPPFGDVAQSFAAPPPEFGVPHALSYQPPLPPAGPVAGPPALPPLARAACENRLNSRAALAAFLVSKLRLNAVQHQRWRSIEEAAQPALEKLHSACDRLPTEPSAAPSPMDVLDLSEMELEARLELIRAIREPLRSLYGTLTPEQRAALQPPIWPPQRPWR